MSNVYSIDGEEDSFVAELKQLLKDIDDNQNPDLCVVFKGYLHNKSGFKFRCENLEQIDSSLFDDWKSAILEKGMSCHIQPDFINAWVDIVCKRVLRRRTNLSDRFPKLSMPTLPSIPFSLLVYITVIFGIIYLLWMRHREKFQE